MAVLPLTSTCGRDQRDGDAAATKEMACEVGQTAGAISSAVKDGGMSTRGNKKDGDRYLEHVFELAPPLPSARLAMKGQRKAV